MGKDKKNRSLSFTLAISFLSLILASLLIQGGIEVFLNFRAQQSIVFSRQQLVAQNAANKVKAFIQDKFSALETTARLVNPTLTPLAEQNRVLNHLFTPHPSFRQLVLLDSKKHRTAGISRLSQEGSGEIATLFGDDLFIQTRLGNNCVSSVYVDRITSEPMVILAVPAIDVFGDFQGALIAEVNLKFMWDLVERLKIGETGVAYVVDRHGKLIAFGDISRVLRDENAGGLKVVQEFINNPLSVDSATANVSTGINGAPTLGSYVSLGVPDWAVVTELPVREAYRSVIQSIVSTSVFTLVMAALAGWIGIFLARRLSVPLVNLMETASRISGGEMELQANTEGPAEISSLARAFNSMTAQLREVIGNLEQRSLYLQATVQKYVEYMAEVGDGKFDSRLELKKQEDETDDPLIILGWQLHHTTESIQEMIEQIRDSTNKLQRHEVKLQIYSDKLERSNKELEQFAYIASHDLQAPLKKIKFCVDKLKLNYGEIRGEKDREYMEMINKVIVRMENLIRDLLYYSRVTTKIKPFESVDLNTIVKEVLGDLEISITETNAEIKTGTLPVINADALQMRQLFQNIIGNAIKYHLENVPPVIGINSAMVLNGENDFCEITITDNGIGFDNKYVERIFGLFQRLHGRDEYEGAGLGLAICKKIVEQHGGAINAFGKEGEGATFSIKLPLIPKN